MPQSHTGVREIAIKNFRGIDELNIAFVGPQDYATRIGVIAGPNGSGKTAILEACLLAAGHDHLVRGKTGVDAVRQGAEDYQIDVVVQGSRGPREGRGVRATSRGRGQRVAPFAYFSSWRSPQLVGSLGITAGKRGKRPAKSEPNRLLNVKQFLINARAHEFFPKASPPGPSPFEKVARDLNEAWGLFYPGQSFSVEPVGDDPEQGFDVFLRAGDRRLPVDSLSSGQLEVFMLAGGLATEDFDHGVIVIDEPELHLDPQWHRIVLRALQILRPNCQILVATHSPEVFDSVMSFERHFLLPAEDPRSHAWLAGLGQGERR